MSLWSQTVDADVPVLVLLCLIHCAQTQPAARGRNRVALLQLAECLIFDLAQCLFWERACTCALLFCALLTEMTCPILGFFNKSFQMLLRNTTEKLTFSFSGNRDMVCGKVTILFYNNCCSLSACQTWKSCSVNRVHLLKKWHSLSTFPFWGPLIFPEGLRG